MQRLQLDMAVADGLDDLRHARRKAALGQYEEAAVLFTSTLRFLSKLLDDHPRDPAILEARQCIESELDAAMQAQQQLESLKVRAQAVYL